MGAQALVLLLSDNEPIYFRGRYLGSLVSRPDWLVIVLEVDLSALTMCCDENNDMYKLQWVAGIQIVKFSLARNSLCKCSNLEHTPKPFVSIQWAKAVLSTLIKPYVHNQVKQVPNTRSENYRRHVMKFNHLCFGYAEI